MATMVDAFVVIATMTTMAAMIIMEVRITPQYYIYGSYTVATMTTVAAMIIMEVRITLQYYMYLW